MESKAAIERQLQETAECTAKCRERAHTLRYSMAIPDAEPDRPQVNLHRPVGSVLPQTKR